MNERNMDCSATRLERRRPRRPRGAGWLYGCMALMIVSGTLGCAALTNPAANGIPVRRLPIELLAKPRERLRTIPLTALRVDPPSVYRLWNNDVLGIYIEGVLPVNMPGQPPSNPPVFFPSQYSPLARALPPAMGYPIPVQADGTILLPLSVRVKVDGMTIPEAEEAIRRSFTEREILQPGRERITVTLMQPRSTRVIVMRQELGGFLTGQTGIITTSTTKRGTGHVIELPAYQNDVLTALALTGGMPGLDDYNQIIIFKGSRLGAQDLAKLPPDVPYYNPLDQRENFARVINIPLRTRPGETLPFRPEDIVLEQGDVLLLEARVVELYYTGGLLPAGEQVLPRDYDLDVVEAIAQIKGPLINGAFNGSNLSGPVINTRPIGNENPSLLTVIRRTPDGGQVLIRIDLNRAMRDARERLIVQASDVLILQETPGEAFARYMSQVFSFGFASKVINTGSTTGTTNLAVP